MDTRRARLRQGLTLCSNPPLSTMNGMPAMAAAEIRSNQMGHRGNCRTGRVPAQGPWGLPANSAELYYDL